MKPISQAVERRYMEAISAAARSTDSGLVDVRGDALADLRRRPDFSAVLDYLNARGWVKLHNFDDGPWFVSLTEAGRTYFEDHRDAASERRWTRGLAIAAIVISIAALFVSVLSLWLQWKSQ